MVASDILNFGRFKITKKDVMYEFQKQRSKLTFSKSHLLATFNYKMVAIKKFWLPKKKE